jgi:hypothetical protein
VLDVIPADIPGMDFATRNLISDYQVRFPSPSVLDVMLTLLKVYFSLRDDGTRLVIRTRRESEIHELIPYHNLTGDLPKLLVENYTHWLNLSTGEMELRALETPLKSSDQNWRIHFSSLGRSDMRQQRTSLMVDIRSPTFKMVSACLAPLERAEYLTVTCSSDEDTLSVHLPRFRLSFFLNSRGFLESHNWPGMVIDANQSSGTMYGLSSQLLLRAEHHSAPELAESRRVIIPHGKPQFSIQDHHVCISIDTTTGRTIRYYEYNIDTDLGCLTGNTLESRLFKVWMHALSSHCLPDPLTGRTGTEEALHDLGSASCQSFQRLGANEADILRHINSLTPNRVFYPPHKQVMQTVVWSTLPSLSQHYGFFMITQSIMKYAELLDVFDVSESGGHGSLSEDHSWSRKDVHLLERAALRNATLYTEEFKGLQPMPDADTVHISRDLPSQRTSVSDVSEMVHLWPTRLPTSKRLIDNFREWSFISGPRIELSLSYSRDWLEVDLAKTWISLYDLCRCSSRDTDCFRLQFSLSAMAYRCSVEDRNLIPTILAFATTSRFRGLQPPLWTSYDLSKGNQPKESKLQDLVKSSTISFDSSPESKLPRTRKGESDASLERRRRTSFDTRQDEEVRKVVQELLDQWPCPSPQIPRTATNGFFDAEKLMKSVRARFQRWHQNADLRYHIRDVQFILDKVYVSDSPRCPAYTFKPCSNGRPSAPSRVAFDQLLKRPAPTFQALAAPHILSTPKTDTKVYRNSSNMEVLKSLLSQFRSSSDRLHQLYGRGLDESRECLDSDTASAPFPNVPLYPIRELAKHRDHCREYFQQILAVVRQSMHPSNMYEQVLFMAGQWPHISTKSLLAKLAFTSRSNLNGPWKVVLITLAQALLWFQRSRRLLQLAYVGNFEELYQELENVGSYHGWVDNPDWLLIQVNLVV